MQLSIVARPNIRNRTSPQKKSNCGKSKLQELNFSPKKCNYQLWHVQTSEIELFPPKNAIVASPNFRNWTFSPKNAIVASLGLTILEKLTFPPKKCNCGKSGLQELNFSPKNAIVASLGLTILEKLTFPPKKMQVSRLQELNLSPPKMKNYQLWHVQTSEFQLSPKKVKSVIVRNWTFAPPKFGKKQKCVGESLDFKHWGFPPNNPSDGKVQFQVHENPGWIQIIDIYIDGTFTPSSSRLKFWNTGLRNGFFTKQSSLVLWETQE